MTNRPLPGAVPFVWYDGPMRRPLIIGLIVIVVVLGVLELTYFRFHTYLLSTEVQETLPPMPSDAPAAMQPRTLASGAFGEVDFVHKGSGTARIVEQDGVRYLRLENFEVTNGPDLFVYLAEGDAPTSAPSSLGGYADLGPLKGNRGNLTYEIAAGTPETYTTAVIWCKEFGVLFSFAVMR